MLAVKMDMLGSYVAIAPHVDTAYGATFPSQCPSIPPLPFMSRAQIADAQYYSWTVHDAY